MSGSLAWGLTPDDEAAWNQARREQREFELAGFEKKVEALQRIFSTNEEVGTDPRTGG
ncbi:MAG: hypothetical protein K2X38_19335 [Gemmataceae bacterium]|nr:hypothetical protein [Gemmataceae bacterium]